MANIQITIPDNVVNRLLTAISSEYNYDLNKLNAETEAQFAKRMLIEKWAKDILRRQEGRTAGMIAQSAAEASADSEVSIT